MSEAFVAFGDSAFRAALPAGTRPRDALDVLRAETDVVDVVVTERHVLVVGREGRGDEVRAAAEAALARTPRRGDEACAARLHRVRVRYDGEDLARVAAFAGIAPAEVARLHAARTYVVACVGFQPGFAYLAVVDPVIAAPRLGSPRAGVPPYAVGIAGARTGVYPFASPGGWNLIGVAVGFRPFEPARGAALALGDRVAFEATS